MLSPPEEPWIWEVNSIRRQIKHYRARQIAADLNRHSYLANTLICEDCVQKIRSPHQLDEVKFLYHTEHHKIQEFHDYRLSDENDVVEDEYKESDHEQDYWDNMDEYEYHNVINMMEG